MDLTFVFPCLNEERFIAACIERVRKTLSADPDLKFEIVVGDNGSTDRSREIATEAGARVVPIPVRGYGAALRGGIAAAEGKYVMFADADGTYIYEHALDLYKATVKADADMGIASRLLGKIEPGAMPTLHHYLGTPVLTWLINVLFDGKLTDCNSGFRCLRKTAYDTWDIRASGMEFASELLIKALKHKARSVEIPSGLRPPPLERHPHLRTWRDGMRHLLFILSERPRLFEAKGLMLVIVASLLQAIAAVTGPVSIGGLHIFDIHSQTLLLLGAIIGAQLYLFSCMLYLQSKDEPLKLTQRLIKMDEGSLFFLLLSLLVGFGGVVLWIVVWAHFLCVPVLGALGLLGVHVMRTARQ